MFHRLFNTQIPLSGFPFLGRSGGSLGEVFYKHFPSRNPFLHGLSERLGEVGRSFSKFHLFKDRFLLSRSEESNLNHHPPSGRLRYILKEDYQNCPKLFVINSTSPISSFFIQKYECFKLSLYPVVFIITLP